jgi:hypothetical protein
LEFKSPSIFSISTTSLDSDNSNQSGTSSECPLIPAHLLLANNMSPLNSSSALSSPRSTSFSPAPPLVHIVNTTAPIVLPSRSLSTVVCETRISEEQMNADCPDMINESHDR